MSEWRCYHLYYSELDRLVLDCVHPFLERARPRLERAFWERRFAGGPHLRVRLRGPAAEVAAQGETLCEAARRFMTGRPSPELASYSPARAAALLRREREEPGPDDLYYRNDSVEERDGRPPAGPFASEEARELAEDFRHDSMPLAALLLRSERGRGEELLRLLFLHALLVCGGDLPAGCVSCRSHWEGFAASFPSPEAVERIRESRRRSRETLHAQLRDVVERWEAGTVDGDPVLASWRGLLETYRARARRLLEAGTPLTEQPETPEEARQVRERMFTHFRDDSEFVRTFWSDERFIAALGSDASWLVPRVLINLLYQLAATAGVSPIDRMALCYYAFRTAEEHYGCDLGEILKANIARTLAAHAGPAAPATQHGPGGD